MREVRGLSQTQLAEMLAVTNAGVSAYETGRSKPSPNALEAMATVLHAPVDFFLRPARAPRSGVAFYRSLSSATKKARTRAEHRLEWLMDIVRYMDELVELPPVALPDFHIRKNPLDVSDQDVEALASEAREFWGMGEGPVANVTRLLENHGVILTLDNLDADALDSLSLTASRPYIMVSRDKGTAVRWRYDVAHELGHLIMHSHLDQRVVSRSVEAAAIEDQAHRFAGAFLLPLGPFMDDFYSASLDTLYNMKAKWRVSMGAMIMRASKASIISPETAQRLHINHSRRGWKRHEPLDDQIEPEFPRALAEAEAVILRSGHSADDLRQAVALSDSDIETLCGLPSGYLRNADAPPILPRLMGNVLQFPTARES